MQRRALRPAAEHEIRVQIRVPRRREKGIVEIDETRLPTEPGLVTAVVDVRCDALGLHEIRELIIPTGDRTLAARSLSSLSNRVVTVMPWSSVSMFLSKGDTRRCRCGRDGPNDGPAARPGDRATRPVFQRSRTPQWTDAGIGQPSSGARGASPPRHRRDLIADLSSLQAHLDVLEQAASRTLGLAGPPASFGDGAGKTLLIELARFLARSTGRWLTCWVSGAAAVISVACQSD